MEPFTLLHGIPHGDCTCRALSPELCVPYDSPDKTVVARGNSVVVVKIQLGQCGKINLEFEFRRYDGCELVIQSVDSFHNEDVVWTEVHGLSLVIALSLMEVVAWHVDCLSVKKREQIFINLLYVQSLKTLVVIISILILRCLGASTVV